MLRSADGRVGVAGADIQRFYHGDSETRGKQAIGSLEQSKNASSKRYESQDGRDPNEVGRRCRPSMRLPNAKVHVWECGNHLGSTNNIICISGASQLEQNMARRPSRANPQEKGENEKWVVEKEGEKDVN